VERLDALETIIDWIFEGLDLDKAMSQPATPYKVRHLKMGVRVAGALSACDSYIAFRMLVCVCLYLSIHQQFFSVLFSVSGQLFLGRDSIRGCISQKQLKLGL